MIGIISGSLLACGMCVDHILDFFAPWICPLFPFAVLMLIIRRILSLFQILPTWISQPKSLFLFLGVLFGWVFIGNGALSIIMLLPILVVIFRSVQAGIRFFRIPLSVHSRKSKTLVIIFSLLWLASIATVVEWIFSQKRMEYHLSYSGRVIEPIRRSYARHASRYASIIRQELTAACQGQEDLDFVYFSNLFYLAAHLNDISLASCIEQLVLKHGKEYNLYTSRFVKEGLLALQASDNDKFRATCGIVLTQGFSIENERDAIRDMCTVDRKNR